MRNARQHHGSHASLHLPGPDLRRLGIDAGSLKLEEGNVHALGGAAAGGVEDWR